MHSPRISAPNFFMHTILICYSCSQVSELWHTFKGSVVHLFCILLMISKHTLQFPQYSFLDQPASQWPISFAVLDRIYLFLHPINNLQTAQTKSWRLPCNFNSSWFIWSFLQATNRNCKNELNAGMTMSHAPGGLILCWPEMATLAIEFPWPYHLISRILGLSHMLGGSVFFNPSRHVWPGKKIWSWLGWLF